MERTHPTMPMADLGPVMYLTERPSTRFPVYTRGNVGEVYPEAVYPLSFSMARSAVTVEELAALMLDTRMVTRSDVAEGFVTMGGVFGGYQYLNLSLQRVLAVRAPGTSIEESDATFFSSHDLAPPHEPHPDDKNLRASIGAVRYVLGLLRVTEVEGLAEERELATAWRDRESEILEGSDAELLATLDELGAIISSLFIHHLDTTNRAGAALQLLARICKEQLGDKGLALTLLGGIGEVDSALPSIALWRLGRMVAEDSELTTMFDDGPDGLEERISASVETNPAASDFCDAFDSFCFTHAARGQNEWETASQTWGTDRTQPLTLIDRMRSAGPDHDPVVAAKSLSAKREAAITDARARLRGPNRWVFNRALRAATVLSRARERSKTTVVDVVHVSRLIIRELGRRTAERGRGGTMFDIWFVGYDELVDYVAKPDTFGEVIAERRAARDFIVEREPPFAFAEELPPIDTWPLRASANVADDSNELARPGDVLAGVPGCPGVAEGRARIVLDPTDPGDLGPGDVLVAPHTDPAWTPLFVPVEAVVVNVGGQMSHAVIVARELGQPCVVAVTGATGCIADGARIRVDGTVGTITILD